MKHIFSLALVILFASQLFAQKPGSCPNYNTNRDAFDDFVALQIEEGKLHGIGLAVVTADGFDFIKGYGTRVGSLPITMDTIFRVASVSKTITSTALIIAAQQGLIDYDGPINSQNIGQAASSPCKDVDCLLSWKFSNPHYPTVDSTPRQINSFYASIYDTDLVESFFNNRTSMENFLAGYLLQKGNYYACDSFAEHQAGCIYIYSNVSATMSAYLTQRATGLTFPMWCDMEIFTPLVMRDTSWNPDLFDRAQRARIAEAYSYQNGQYQPAEKTDPFPFYPAGGLFTTLGDMGKFARMIFSDGKTNSIQVLKRGTVATLGMQTDLVGCDLRQGDMWFRIKGNLNLLMKLGSSFGVSSLMVIDTKNQLAYLAFANGRDEANETNSVDAIGKIVTCMMATAAPDSIIGLDGNVAKTCNTVIVTPQTPKTNCANQDPAQPCSN